MMSASPSVTPLLQLVYRDNDDLQDACESVDQVVRELANCFVEKKLFSRDDAEEQSRSYLQSGAQLLTNGPDDYDVNPKIKDLRKKLPTFLFFNAPIEPEGTARRKNEKIQRRREGDNFLQAAFGSNAHAIPNEYEFVDSYAEMVEKTKTFFKVKAQGNNMPFIVFLGHGEKDTGQLCFMKDRKALLQAMKDLRALFEENKGAEVYPGTLRFVFTECYAHLIDDGDNAGKVRAMDGTEYIYFSSPTKGETTSAVRQGAGDTTRLQQMKDHGDIYLHLWYSHTFLQSNYDKLKKLAEKVYKDCGYQTVCDMVRLEVYPSLYKTNGLAHIGALQKEVKELRKNMKAFLQINIPPSSQTKEEMEMFQQYNNGSFAYKVEDVTSHNKLIDAIDKFLQNDKIEMPIVLVSGPARRDEKGNPLLLFPDGSKMSSSIIFNKYKSRDQFRMVLSCYEQSASVDQKHLIASNSTIPETTDSTNKDIKAKESVVDGPENKNIVRD